MSYPKDRRVLIIATADAAYLEAGCEPIQALTGAQWRCARASLHKQGYRVITHFRLPMRRLAPGWGWWGFACEIMRRKGGAR